MRLKLSLTIFNVLIITCDSTVTFPKTSSSDFDSVGASRKSIEFSRPETVIFNVANLGLKIVRELLQESNKNVIVSPFNIYSCLGILELGAAGITREEILEVLGTPSINTSLSMAMEGDGLSSSSAVFLDDRFTPKDDFTEAAAMKYMASVLNLNFSDHERAQNFINRWVSDHTNGTINNFLDGALDSETKMIVLSTLFFNGKWLQAFSPAATTIGKFYENEDSVIDAELMHLMANISVVRNSLLDAIGLPYQNERMTLYLILPKETGMTGVKKLLSHLNIHSMKKLKTESVLEEILVVLPKMIINGRYSLTSIIKRLGVSSIFDPAKADFSNIVQEDGERLLVSDFYHSIHFKVNEEGTTASAATAAIFTKSSKYVFKATRPFIISITDKEGMVYFMGAVARPLDSSLPF